MGKRNGNPQYAKLAKSDKEKVANRLFAAKQKTQKSETKVLRAQIGEIENRLAVIAGTLKNLYIDKCSETIPENVFTGLMNDFTDEQTQLQEQLPKLQSELASVQETTDEISEWIDLISSYTNLKTLTRSIVTELIGKRTVSERNEVNGKIEQTIDIEYRFIGNLLQAKKKILLDFSNNVFYLPSILASYQNRVLNKWKGTLILIKCTPL